MRTRKKSGSVLVVGSANMDMVVNVDRFPKPGETILGGSFAMHPGGKGANQAVCASRLGANVLFVGKMGSDTFHDTLTENMTKEGVDLRFLLQDRGASTGIALITVDSDAQNEIIVVSGSNMTITPEEIEKLDEAFEDAGVLLLQLEIPLATVICAADMAKARGIPVILNPAPARTLPSELLRQVDYLTPNETEAEILTGIAVSDPDSAEIAGKALLTRGVKNVIVTLGDQGALFVSQRATRLFPAQEVMAVDTTAAGDAFNGALAVSILRGGNISRAVERANMVAALAVGRRGAQTSMPTEKELKAFARLARSNQKQLVATANSA